MKRIKVNPEILRQCREQMNLALDFVKQKIHRIEAFEAGEKEPTFKQLSKLAVLYSVPRWVFTASVLPEVYQYDKKPAFRKFRAALEDTTGKIPALVAKIEQYRELFLELREDIGEPVADFNPPQYSDSPEELADAVRKWLKLDKPVDFYGLKQRLEEKNIFIFLTSKNKGWSYIDSNRFRGLSIYHPCLPVIIINDADSWKAQSFTLFHELGHILRKKTRIDLPNQKENEEERWCDDLSGHILMPVKDFANIDSNLSLNDIKTLAKKFEVSPHACLVRLRRLEKLTFQSYQRLENQLLDEYNKRKAKQRKNKGGPPRNRPKEVEKQFGHSFIKAVIDNYHNDELSLHKSTKILDFRQPKHFMELAKNIQ